MADLKAAVSTLGFTEVTTYLQSGNLVFRSSEDDGAALAARIAMAIRDHQSMDVGVMVRTARQWGHVISANPYPQAETLPKTVHAFILDRMPEPGRIAMLEAKEAGSEEWRIADGTLYLHTPDGFGKSVLGNIVERTLKVSMTARNWNTVRALQGLADAL
ncbi:MAG: DUF1697 domain-containing protein [Rhizobiaceae bacterium]|nr:DUF1697 domain-containing protein [Rhizobiaceae bacterium]